MRIGLIADTHIPDSDQKLPFEIYPIFKGVDLIIHVGDIYSVSVLDDLEKIVPVKSARGDDDWIVDDQRLEDRLLLTIEGRSIRVEHQFAVLHFYSNGFIGLEDVAEKIKEYPDLPDILIFGHSHKPLTLEMEDTLGGIAKNKGVVRALEKLIGITALRPNFDTQIVGAVGAALYARALVMREKGLTTYS